MASEQMQVQGIKVVTAPADEAEQLTWAAKWDMWSMRVVASGWALITLDELFNLERSVWTSSWGFRFDIAVPLFFGASIAHTVWKARQGKRIEKELARHVIMSIFFILSFTYSGMVELRHFLR